MNLKLIMSFGFFLIFVTTIIFIGMSILQEVEEKSENRLVEQELQCKKICGEENYYYQPASSGGLFGGGHSSVCECGIKDGKRNN